jgi:hypothetical protein
MTLRFVELKLVISEEQTYGLTNWTIPLKIVYLYLRDATKW